MFVIEKRDLKTLKNNPLYFEVWWIYPVNILYNICDTDDLKLYLY